ncbi:MAG: hypothetical protein JST82_00995 [Bacteroidetes bacterium]|nr:hypothetical protein [Bacteroidota bacterium]
MRAIIVAVLLFSSQLCHSQRIFIGHSIDFGVLPGVAGVGFTAGLSMKSIEIAGHASVVVLAEIANSGGATAIAELHANYKFNAERHSYVYIGVNTGVCVVNIDGFSGYQLLHIGPNIGVATKRKKHFQTYIEFSPKIGIGQKSTVSNSHGRYGHTDYVNGTVYPLFPINCGINYYFGKDKAKK